ncbi:methyl-accepting chemotaxis protein [Paenibacillus donghaensis]|uniref:methyl-accepting chemotaxis protein n=1 Tax=Paenibacillus donghaensis TaxID=414771 RepID=UPI00147087DD|nr:methyl-accepting chemotaxis protein [Paenibacillus donghaensis]
MVQSKPNKQKTYIRLHPAKSIGVRLFLLFFISTMVLVLSLGYTSYSVARETIEDNALAANQQTVIQTAEKLDIELLRYEDRLDQLLASRELHEVLQADAAGGVAAGTGAGAGSEKLTSELERWLSAGEGVQAVMLIPAAADQPVLAAGSVDTAFGEGARASAWYKQLVGKPQAVWITGAAGDGGAGVIRLAKSSTDETGGPGYVVVSDIPVQELEDQLRKVNLGPASYMQLVTGQDELIASSQEQETDAYLQLGGTLFEGLSESSGSLPTQDERGKSILAVYGTLDSSSWKLLGVVPAENLSQDAVRILRTTYLVVGAAALVAILIGFLMVRMVSRPLNRLGDLMSQGAEGKLGVRTKVTSRDEIGRLSSSFNLMMERISELVTHTNETAREVLGYADELGSASRKTAAAAKDIASATEEIAGGAGGLALEADRGNELTRQISAQISAVAANAHEMDNTARSVGVLSGKGVSRLSELQSRTGNTGELTNRLVEKVNELKETASSVIQVLEVMKSITQQTNILSLNASIEAARAGEAGQGFKVVADEIRQLANQSKSSIAMVGEITDKIMNDMNETVFALAEVAPLFHEQMDSVKNTSEIFVTVQAQMEQFITRLDSVTYSIDGLGQSQRVLSETIGNVSSFAEESSAASEEVASLSGEQQSVSDHLVGLSAKLERASSQLKDRLSKFSL